MRCPAVYVGPSAAKGAQCLLDAGNHEYHETYGIGIVEFNVERDTYRVLQDGSQRWKWPNDSFVDTRYLELAGVQGPDADDRQVLNEK